MSTFTFKDQEYELVERPTFGECAWVERQAKTGFDEMFSMTKMAAITLISLRRGGTMLSWEDMENLSPADIVMKKEAAEAAEEAVSGTVPTGGAAKSGASRS